MRLWPVLLLSSAILGQTDNNYVNLILFKQNTVSTTYENNSIIPIMQADSTPISPITNPKLLTIMGKINSDNIIFSGKLKLTDQQQEWTINNKLINGKLTITAKTFFNCKFKFNVHNNQNTIALKQTIRTKEKQLAYVDHPLIGILLYIDN